MNFVSYKVYTSDKEPTYDIHERTSLYLKRDRYIVDNSHELMIYWDGVKKGGTYQTAKYAASKPNYPIRNIWGVEPSPLKEGIYVKSSDV